MIEKTFPYSIKIHNYSSISYKLFDLLGYSISTTNIVLLFFTQNWPFFVLVTSPASCESCQKKNLWNKTIFCKL